MVATNVGPEGQTRSRVGPPPKHSSEYCCSSHTFHAQSLCVPVHFGSPLQVLTVWFLTDKSSFCEGCCSENLSERLTLSLLKISEGSRQMRIKTFLVEELLLVFSHVWALRLASTALGSASSGACVGLEHRKHLRKTPWRWVMEHQCLLLAGTGVVLFLPFPGVQGLIMLFYFSLGWVMVNTFKRSFQWFNRMR